MGRLLVMALERGGAFVELVELEAAGERLLAVVLEKVVGLLVVEDGARSGRGVGVVADDGAAGEPLQLADGPEPLLGVRLIPVIAVGQGDRLADVRADVDLRLGAGATTAASAQSQAAARGRRDGRVRTAMAWAG
jgi:hypothetical protein